MATPGRIDVTMKFSELPAEVEVDAKGWRRFVLDCGGKLVRVGMRPKNWAKVEQAAKDWPLWVVSLAGSIQLDSEGLAMPEANAQAFERKPKHELASCVASPKNVCVGTQGLLLSLIHI